MTHHLKHWLNLCEELDSSDGIIGSVDQYKVGDWVFSDIAKDTGQIIKHDRNPDADNSADSEFYSIKWPDATISTEVPRSTLQRVGKPPPAQNKQPTYSAHPIPPAKPQVNTIIKGRKLVIVSPTTSILDASRLILRNNIGALPVMTGRNLVGIISERDIVAKVVAYGADTQLVTVGQVMTKNPATIAAHDPLSKAMKMMKDGGFRHLPIVSGQDVIGVLSLRDILQ